MGAPTDPVVALLSIHPRYAEAILEGEKRVEFRKRRFARPVDRVVIYATAPVQRIVGTFAIEAIDVDVPSALWQRYGAVGGIDRGVFDAYYLDADEGMAIKVGEVAPVIAHLPLAALGNLCPPQSYQYLESEALCRLEPVVAGRSADPGWPGAAGRSSRGP